MDRKREKVTKDKRQGVGLKKKQTLLQLHRFKGWWVGVK